MEDKEKDSQEFEGTEVFQLTPLASPSKNYLVIENLQRMPNIFSRGLLYLMILSLLSALIYSLLGKIDMVTVGRAVARPTSDQKRILSQRNGYIEKIFISEGQIVEKNDPLFHIRSKEVLTYLSKVEELDHSLPLKKEYYQTKISSTLDELNQLYTYYSNSLKVNKLKLEQNSLLLNSMESDLSYWQKERESLSEEYKSMKKPFEGGDISIAEYNYIRSELERARTEVEKLRSKRDITLKEKKIIEGEIEKEREDYKNKKVILEKEMKSLKIEMKTTLNAMQNELEMYKKILSLQDESSANKNDEKGKEEIVRTVKAGHAGTISELYFRNTGEYVRESDLLCTILPANEPLYMDITVTNKDIGFMEKGMEIKYKFDAFPYTDYGIRFGKVLAISPSAVEDRTLGIVYHVQGTLDMIHFEIRGKKYPIKPGMTATAEMVREKKSIFSILFKKLKG